jgi:hypothetical protein
VGNSSQRVGGLAHINNLRFAVGTIVLWTGRDCHAAVLICQLTKKES